MYKLSDRSLSKLKQKDALPEKAFGAEFFMKASMYGQAVTRYQSLAMRQFLERVLGDRNVMYRDAKKGVEPTGDGNVYGGSVKSSSAASLSSIQNVDGFLIGGASLDPKEFEIIGEIVAETLGNSMNSAKINGNWE